MTKVGINGFGRIGRQVLKSLVENYSNDLEVVAINDLFDTKANAHLFKYDSTYGKFNGTVDVAGSDLVINGKNIKVFNEKDPANIPWGDLGVEIVIESTGIFTDAIVLGVTFSAAVGIIFGWAPARKASKLNPIDALRAV